jgi:hypothetical protein
MPQLHQNTLQLQEEMKQAVIIRAPSRQCILLSSPSFVYIRSLSTKVPMSHHFPPISCEDGSGNGYQDTADRNTHKRSPEVGSFKENEQSWRRPD